MNEIETITNQLQSATPEQLAAIMAILNPVAVKKQTLTINIDEQQKAAAIASINVDGIAKKEQALIESAQRRINRLKAITTRTAKQQAKMEKLARQFAIAI